jgi:membrane protein
MAILWRSLINFFKHDGPMLAGSITCFFIMSIIPFLLFLVAILGYFLGEYQAFYDFLAARVADFSPKATYEVMAEIQKTIRYQRVGFFSLILYAYFSFQLYFAFERAVNLIFESQGKRSLLKSMLLSLLLAFSLIILLVVFFGIRVILPFVETVAHYIPWLKCGVITRVIMGFLLPMVFWFLMTTTLFMVLPEKRIRLYRAVLGALATTFLLEAGKYLFTYYAMFKVSQFGMIYGSLTAVVIFLLWVFFAACVFLIGAEIVRDLESAEKQASASDPG